MIKFGKAYFCSVEILSISQFLLVYMYTHSMSFNKFSSMTEN